MPIRPIIGLVPVLLAAFVTPATAQPGEPLTAAVRLKQPGAEPRQELRYSLRPAQRSELRSEIVSITIADGRKLPTQLLPAVTFPLTIATAEEGDGVRCTITVGEARAVLRDPRDSNLDKVNRSLSLLRGAEINGRFSPRGICAAAEFKFTDAAKAAASGAELHQMMAKAIVPLPEEPVGLGAVWTAELNLAAAGGRTRYAASYTLRERQGDLLVLDVGLRESGEPGELDAPAPGATLKLDGVSGEGDGTVVVALDRLLPVAASTTHTVKSIMTASSPQRTIHTEMMAEHRTTVRDSPARD